MWDHNRQQPCTRNGGREGAACKRLAKSHTRAERPNPRHNQRCQQQPSSQGGSANGSTAAKQEPACRHMSHSRRGLAPWPPGRPGACFIDNVLQLWQGTKLHAHPRTSQARPTHRSGPSQPLQARHSRHVHTPAVPVPACQLPSTQTCLLQTTVSHRHTLRLCLLAATQMHGKLLPTPLPLPKCLHLMPTACSASL